MLLQDVRVVNNRSGREVGSRYSEERENMCILKTSSFHFIQIIGIMSTPFQFQALELALRFCLDGLSTQHPSLLTRLPFCTYSRPAPDPARLRAFLPLVPTLLILLNAVHMYLKQTPAPQPW